MLERSTLLWLFWWHVLDWTVALSLSVTSVVLLVGIYRDIQTKGSRWKLATKVLAFILILPPVFFETQDVVSTLHMIWSWRLGGRPSYDYLIIGSTKDRLYLFLALVLGTCFWHLLSRLSRRDSWRGWNQVAISLPLAAFTFEYFSADRARGFRLPTDLGMDSFFIAVFWAAVISRMAEVVGRIQSNRKQQVRLPMRVKRYGRQGNYTRLSRFKSRVG